MQCLRPYLKDDHISRTRGSQVGFLSSPLISRIFFLSFKLSQKNYPNETLYVESIQHFVSTSSYIPLSYDWRTEIVRLVNDVKVSLAFIPSVAFQLVFQLTYVALLISTSSILQREEDRAPLKKNKKFGTIMISAWILITFCGEWEFFHTND